VTTLPSDVIDAHWMRVALALARRGLGQVAPNPAVGCVLVQYDHEGGRVVGRGWTQPGGRPHAETEAIGRAGKESLGSVAYVTLEPCAHQGHTDPCADALISAGIKRAVVATLDPDERVSGKGILRMKRAGIQVDLGCCNRQARQLNAGFLATRETGRPHVALKVATTFDGKIAAINRHSQWITGPESRAYGHLLRSRFDVILTGSGTVLNDNPMMTCRLPGLEKYSPIRALVLGHRKIPFDSKILSYEHGPPTLVYLGYKHSLAEDNVFLKKVEVCKVRCDTFGYPVLSEILADLVARGITRVLVEAGSRLNTAFLKAEGVDEIHWFRASTILGNDSIPVIGDLGQDNVEKLRRFSVIEQKRMGNDMYELLSKQANG
tara:strand:+ start:14 stop:1147 length:1134 start_codon:yes stop_codon:yes gene_type:complete